MNLPSVQENGTVPPWREGLFSSDCIEIGCAATVGPMPRCPGKVALCLQFIQSTLHGGAGQLEPRGNCIDSRPALALAIGAILEVHIDRHGSMGDIRVGIDGSKITHSPTSRPDMGSGFFHIRHGGLLTLFLILIPRILPPNAPHQILATGIAHPAVCSV